MIFWDKKAGLLKEIKDDLLSFGWQRKATVKSTFVFAN